LSESFLLNGGRLNVDWAGLCEFAVGKGECVFLNLEVYRNDTGVHLGHKAWLSVIAA